MKPASQEAFRRRPRYRYLGRSLVRARVLVRVELECLHIMRASGVARAGLRGAWLLAPPRRARCEGCVGGEGGGRTSFM